MATTNPAYSFHVYLKPSEHGEPTRLKRQLFSVDTDDGDTKFQFDTVDCRGNRFCGHSCCYLEYQCSKCKQWRPWHIGGTDSPVCDDCWVDDATRSGLLTPSTEVVATPASE